MYESWQSNEGGPVWIGASREWKTGLDKFLHGNGPWGRGSRVDSVPVDDGYDEKDGADLYLNLRRVTSDAPTPPLSSGVQYMGGHAVGPAVTEANAVDGGYDPLDLAKLNSTADDPVAYNMFSAPGVGGNTVANRVLGSAIEDGPFNPAYHEV